MRAAAAGARRGEATAARRGKGQEQGAGAGTPEVAVGVVTGREGKEGEAMLGRARGVQERGEVDASGGAKARQCSGGRRAE